MGSFNRILDIDTKTHLYRLLAQMPSTDPLRREDFEIKLQRQDMPYYLKKQILKKYDAYASLLKDKTIQGMQDHIMEHQALKSESWLNLKTRLCEQMGPLDYNTGKITMTLKEGCVSLEREVHPYLHSDASRRILNDAIARMYPDVPEDELNYQQLAEVFSELENEVKRRGSRYNSKSAQYASPDEKEHRTFHITEVIAVPKSKDYLAIYFHPEMSDGSWQEAEKFQRLMKERGHDLEYFCLLSEEDDKLQGPFSFEEAREYRPPSSQQFRI